MKHNNQITSEKFYNSVGSQETNIELALDFAKFDAVFATSLSLSVFEG